ncbi:DtxR family Mn-dependent transcriptional regulator [Leifsonia sp. AK011]|uniref:metal-dependent transcriptional regulator n=1 Tax=Leifsonia sp. AK011 TaxID=2723075 RepID=UPI0015CB6B6F|nr:metal-dependent transcriptional regulator [Leifsonia sp. AK011]NYF10240.1 DtxR family Mn-dependent transcriptional regulator [Leifsonia sp. AK011]
MATSPSAIEDYVKVIYAHTEWQSTPITSSVLAARLGLAASSVTEMVKKLVARGLALHEPYGAIELTPAGEELALRMLRRHRLIETWLVEQLGYRWDEVHDEAEVLEHAISDRLLDALDDKLGNPVRDPHGDPIPSRDGVIQRPDATGLGDLAPGSRGTVVRISDRDPAVLRHLDAEGVVLDTVLEVVAVTPDALTVTFTGAELQLSPDAVASIWVSPLP